MTTEYEKLVDYVAGLRANLQHAKAREARLLAHSALRLSLGWNVDEMWEDLESQRKFISITEEQLSEYETFIGWK